MRSKVFTLLLLVVTLGLCGLAGWSLTQGNLDRFLGTPPTPIGERLYDDFKPEQVNHVRVVSNGTKINFYRTDQGWVSTEPWKDRVDHRFATFIIDFTLGMRVADLAPTDDIKLKNAGLKENSVRILLEDGKGNELAKYQLGLPTPWLQDTGPENKPDPTVFIRPRDKNHQDYVYACTGDIQPLFRDNLKYFRDHHPLYFNPFALEKIRIRNEQGELTLGRETPQSPWRITKPLNIGTNAESMKTLIDGLFRLQAAKLANSHETTLPTSGSTTKNPQIAIQHFGSKDETVLEIYPSDSATSQDLMATVSDRPNTVFYLPKKTERGIVTLADLPLTVNDLRDRKLTNINIKSLRGISLKPATGSEILISRTPPQPWMATINGQTQPANEERLATLLHTLIDSKVIDFESDAATDFTPWGLDRPFLKITFLGEDNQAFELNFGFDSKGGVFVNRLGTSTVMRVDPLMLRGISIRPYEWRLARLWSLSRTDLVLIERTVVNQPPLLLKYNDANENWQAAQNDQDVTSYLDPEHANYMLNTLEDLHVSQWLAPDDAAAITALSQPTFTLSVTENAVDEMGDITGLNRRTISFAPASADAKPAYYFGKLNTEPHYFLLDRETFGKISIELMEK
ncbi:MAG: DUF4340 domain-containing protein [Luteolibacter sp.]